VKVKPRDERCRRSSRQDECTGSGLAVPPVQGVAGGSVNTVVFWTGIAVALVGLVVTVASGELGYAPGTTAGAIVLVVGVILSLVGGAQKPRVPSERVEPKASYPPPSALTADMLRALARLPEVQRRAMIETRLNEFYEMPDERRREAMEAMMGAMESLDDEGMGNVTRSRIESLCGFPEEKRVKLMRTHLEALMEMPEDLRAKDVKLTLSELMRMDESCRKAMMRAMKTVMREMPEDLRKRFMGSLPEEVKKILQSD